MKRAFLAIFCGAALIANSVASAADTVSDKEMAERYFQAAQAGDTDAQFYLGALDSSGVGRPRSDEEAFSWFSRAAEHGHSHAMLVLSGLYAIGRGVSKDNVKAYKWAYIVSVGTRVEEFRNVARQLMSVLEPRMTQGQISQAKADAGQWHALPSQARPAASTNDVNRDNRPPPSQPAVSTPAPAGPANSSADSGNPKTSPSASTKKSDMDGLMEMVPSELRKRFGF